MRKTEFLELDLCEVRFTPGWKEGTFYSSGVSAKGAKISASAVPNGEESLREDSSTPRQPIVKNHGGKTEVLPDSIFA